MQIDAERIKRAAGRIRQVGDDAHDYLGRMTGPMDAAMKGTSGLACTATLQTLTAALGKRAAALATESQALAGTINTAVDNHLQNDADRAAQLKALSPAGAGGGR